MWSELNTGYMEMEVYCWTKKWLLFVKIAIGIRSAIITEQTPEI
jgi:hypothetical protein